MTADNTMLTIRRDEMISQAYRALYGTVCGYVAKRIGRQPDVEDIVQDTFLSLLQPGRLISESTLKQYVFSIAHNLVIDWYRRHACSIKAQEYFFAHSPLSVEDADAKVQVSDIMRIEKMTLSEAGEKGRSIYMMYVHEGSCAKDIAAKMGISERTVENHIFRTKNRVREALRKAL